MQSFSDNEADKTNILGVNISGISKDEVLNKVRNFLNDWRQHFIVTPNPEIILKATSQDEELHYILNHADIALADGIAIKIAARFYGKKIKRITGADMTLEILKLAEGENKRVAVFNWARGLSTGMEIKQVLGAKFPRLETFVQDIELTGFDDFSAVAKFAPDIVFCALGAPYQEKFIYYNLIKMPSARLGLPVGGSFDFLTGKVKRAPLLMRKIGLEWLWRLIQQPKRILRIYRATVVFPYRFFIFFFIRRWFYRTNVAALLFKREGEDYKILIAERIGERGHWQLPQGGTDGETLIKAGARELREELNTENFKPVKVYKNLFRYKFSKRLAEQGFSTKNPRGYRGQKQSLFIAEFMGEDSEIKINAWEHAAWRWVEAEKLVEAVHPVRQEAAKIFLEKFWQAVKK